MGHKVGQGNLEPLTETLEKIQGATRPTTEREVRSFLVLTGYYRDFIPNYAGITYDLTDLTKKRAPNNVNWEPKTSEGI